MRNWIESTSELEQDTPPESPVVPLNQLPISRSRSSDKNPRHPSRGNGAKTATSSSQSTTDLQRQKEHLLANLPSASRGKISPSTSSVPVPGGSAGARGTRDRGEVGEKERDSRLVRYGREGGETRLLVEQDKPRYVFVRTQSEPTIQLKSEMTRNAPSPQAPRPAYHRALSPSPAQPPPAAPHMLENFSDIFDMGVLLDKFRLL